MMLKTARPKEPRPTPPRQRPVCVLEVFQLPKTVVWFASLDALDFESGRRRSFLRAGGMRAKTEAFAHERRVVLILKKLAPPIS